MEDRSIETDCIVGVGGESVYMEYTHVSVVGLVPPDDKASCRSFGGTR